jgi:micrococcal nuclease
MAGNTTIRWQVYNRNVERKTSKLTKGNLISTITFILVALFYLVHDKSSPAKKDIPDALVAVVSVSDGDTIKVLINNRQEKVRLIGIDTPEMAQKPWGGYAKTYLEGLLKAAGGRVKLEYDVEKRDKYGRILAYVRTADGQFVNYLLVKNGYAMLFTVPPNVKYVDDLTSAQKEAREKELGIWSKNGLKEKPGTYRKKHPRM